MFDFAGVVALGGRTVEPHWSEALQTPFSGRTSAEYRDEVVQLFQSSRDKPGRSKATTAVARRGGLFLVGDVRVDNESEIRESIAATPERVGNQLVLDYAANDAATFPERLLGAFSLAIWDTVERRLVCVRDHFGVRPFYYSLVGGFFSFSTDIRSLTALGPEYRELDLLRVAQYLEGQPTDEERTFYSAIKRLPRASRLQVANDTIHISRYWSPNEIVDDHLVLSELDVVERFREVFFDAIRCRVRQDERIGCLLSGGLDSSSVTCTTRELLDPVRPVTAFSAIFPGIEEPYRAMIDERRFVDAVAEVDGIVSVRLEADRLTPLSGLDELLGIHGQPFDPPNAYLDYAMCRLAAEHEVDVVLDGLEGDISISHGVHYLDELGHRGDWSRFLRESAKLEERLGLRPDAIFRKYGLEVLLQASPLGFASGLTRLLWEGRFRLAARTVKSRLSAPPKAGHGNSESVLISPDLAAAVDWVNLAKTEDAPFKSEREAHLAFVGKPYIPSIMEFTHANGRHFGLDVRHPMFDRRIVDFCVGLDPGMKLKDGWTRYVLRAAMSGIVPDTVRWRPGKSTLAPNFDLKMANEAKKDVEDVLRSASEEINQFVRKDSISSLLESGRSRTMWPAVVLASFLKKSF